jgi:hypothetical protein
VLSLDALAEGYYQDFPTTLGRPVQRRPIADWCMIIKHRLCLSDKATVAQIQE